MAKLTAEEFIKKWTVDKGLALDDDTIIEMSEDVADSMAVSEGESEEVAALKVANEKLAADYADLKERYKNRFLSSDEKFEEKEDETSEAEPEEKEVIDIKEI